jgi:hypothetical protein
VLAASVLRSYDQAVLKQFILGSHGKRLQVDASRGKKR